MSKEEEEKFDLWKWLSGTGLNPMNWGFGGLLMGLIVLVGGGNWLANSETGKSWIGEDNAGKIGGFFDGLMGWIGGLLPKEWSQKLGLSYDKTINDMPDEELTKKMTENGLTDDAASLITQNRAAFFETVRSANGGSINNLSEITNDKTIYSLLTTQQAMVTKLLSGMKPDPTKPLTSGQKTILESMRTIVTDKTTDSAGKTRLASLLSPERRRATVSMLVPFVDGTTEDALDAQLLSMLDSSGNPSGLMIEVLTRKLTPNASDLLPTMKEVSASILSDPNIADEMKQQLRAIAVKAATAHPDQVVGEKNVTSLAAVQKTIGQSKYEALLTAAVSGDEATLNNLILKDKATLQAFKSFADNADISTLPEQLRAPVTQLKNFHGSVDYLYYVVAKKNVTLEELGMLTEKLSALNTPKPDAAALINVLSDNDVRGLIRKASPLNVIGLMIGSMPNTTPEEKTRRTQMHELLMGDHKSTTPGQPPATNLGYMLDLIESLGATSSQLDEWKTGQTKQQSTLFRTRNFDMLHGLLGLALGDDQGKQTLHDTKGGTIAAYFNTPKVYEAYETFFKHLRLTPAHMKTPQGAMLNALKQHWGTKDDGVVEVLRSPTDANELILQLLKDPAKAPDAALWWNSDHKYDKLKDNLHHLEPIKQAMDMASGTPVKAPAGRTYNFQYGI